jgi:outer membrane lipoprotein-sorting protein
MPRRPPCSCLLLLLATAIATGASAGDDVERVLARFDEVQERIRTLSADFEETRRSTLLKDEIVARGRVYLTKPDSVRWEYSQPEEMRFVISDNEYTGYYPKRKKAERRNVRRWGEQLFRFLGLGQASDELRKFYDIRIGESSPDEGTILLVLEPRKKRVRKRMDAVRLWVDAETYLPVRIRYASRNGNTRVVEFEEMLINPDLSASLYVVDLPDDVKVTKGFSALSGFNGTSHD